MEFVLPDTAGGHLHLPQSMECFVALLGQWPYVEKMQMGMWLLTADLRRFLSYPVLSQPTGSPFSHADDTSLKERTSCSFFGIGGCWLEQRRKGKGYPLPQLWNVKGFSPGVSGEFQGAGNFLSCKSRHKSCSKNCSAVAQLPLWRENLSQNSVPCSLLWSVQRGKVHSLQIYGSENWFSFWTM